MSTSEITCHNCIEPFTNSIFIECTECSPTIPAFNEETADGPSTSKTPKMKLRLCLECFACGAELGSHKKTHKYHVKTLGGELILFTSDQLLEDSRPWSAREELGLLDGIERFNLGNWEDISKHFVRTIDGEGKARTSRELLEHYDHFYLHGAFGRFTLANLKRPNDRDHTAALSINVDSEVVDNSKAALATMPSPPMREAMKKISSDDFRLLAYMPQRDDFEKEFNNDAEVLISNLMILPDDDDLDKAVKVAQIEMYIREVVERRRRKLVARDYDLVSGFLKQEKSFVSKVAYAYSVPEQKKLRMEKELREQLKGFAQFIPSAEFEQLVADIIKERSLKERVKELQDYRREGVTTLEGEKKKDDESSISNHQSNEEGEGESDILTTQRRMSTAGTECASGKSDWPKKTTNPERPNSILSRPEEMLCDDHSLSYKDYLIMKTALLKEQAAKSQGLPMRVNVGSGGGSVDDLFEMKDIVKEFMKQCGWLPYFS